MLDDKAQVSIEYLIMVALSTALAAITLILVADLFSLKDGLKHSLELVRQRMILE